MDVPVLTALSYRQTLELFFGFPSHPSFFSPQEMYWWNICDTDASFTNFIQHLSIQITPSLVIGKLASIVQAPNCFKGQKKTLLWSVVLIDAFKAPNCFGTSPASLLLGAMTVLQLFFWHPEDENWHKWDNGEQFSFCLLVILHFYVSSGEAEELRFDDVMMTIVWEKANFWELLSLGGSLISLPKGEKLTPRKA